MWETRCVVSLQRRWRGGGLTVQPLLQRLNGAVDVLPQLVVDVGGEELLERGQAALGGGNGVNG